MWPKLVSTDSLQMVIVVGFDDVSMQQEDSFISEKIHTTWGGQGWDGAGDGEKNTSPYKIKLLFPAESQKNDRNNTPFMESDSGEGKEAGHVLYAFLILIYTSLLTSAENLGILMSKK